MPGQHGIVGYDALVPGAGVRNQLRDWGGPMDPATWQRRRTAFETTPSIVVAEPKHAASGFTQGVLRGAEYRGGRTVAERFAIAAEAARERSLVYLYVPELDRIGHDRGWGDGAWIDALEAVDGEVAGLVRGLPRDVGLLLTADHGMVDVPATAHLVVPAELLEHVAHVAGEPRALQPARGRRRRRRRARRALARMGWRRRLGRDARGGRRRRLAGGARPGGRAALRRRRRRRSWPVRALPRRGGSGARDGRPARLAHVRGAAGAAAPLRRVRLSLRRCRADP
ncbi:alkaline phosphatase family protein [Agrococcus sp. SL85]|uniref:alkaline phosphatase family protein n=1 Tax=Agrococcus sp. SL85 TaxID=2995141 RepID=UPI00226CD315|nr:alkaline phosphatase family protein [Agrococcus sp. SL85]WAC67520.1 alkaline phosphatase family protein [Agrococcus sp. SL85]